MSDTFIFHSSTILARKVAVEKPSTHCICNGSIDWASVGGSFLFHFINVQAGILQGIGRFLVNSFSRLEKLSHILWQLLQQETCVKGMLQGKISFFKLGPSYWFILIGMIM